MKNSNANTDTKSDNTDTKSEKQWLVSPQLYTETSLHVKSGICHMYTLNFSLIQYYSREIL